MNIENPPPETQTETAMTEPEVQTLVQLPQDSPQRYGAQGKSTIYTFRPESLVIVEDPNHPLYDERVKEPITDAFVRNILSQGVIEPIVVRKNSENGDMEVVAGRKRVKAVIEANRRIAEQGGVPLQIPAMLKRGEDTQMMGVMVSENEARTQDTPLNRARKMQRLLDRGLTESDLSILFVCSKQTVKNLLGLLEASSDVKNAVERGKISAAVAYELSKMSPDLQKERLGKMLAVPDAAPSRPGGRKRGKTRAQRQAAGENVAPSRSEVRAYLKQIRQEADEEWKATVEPVVAWILGSRGHKPRFPKSKNAA